MNKGKDILRKWHEAAAYYWDETSSKCSACLTPFRTGDVNLIFGDLSAAIARKQYLCAQCGFGKMLADKAIPDGGALYVEKRHRGKDLEDLDADVAGRVVEGLTIIDNLAQGLADAAAGRVQAEEPS